MGSDIVNQANAPWAGVNRQDRQEAQAKAAIPAASSTIYIRRVPAIARRDMFFGNLLGIDLTKADFGYILRL
jgi:hypothetical protein